MNFKLVKLAGALSGAAVLTLAGCGGGGGGGGSSTAAASSSTVTVSPALGKFSAGAHVKIKNRSGTVVGTADTVTTGKASVNIGSHTGPMIIEVTGDVGVTYFDENAPGTTRTFLATDSLTAIAPAVQTTIGVTTATHAAVEAIKAKNSGTIPAATTADSIAQANSKIAAALGVTDVLQPPKLVDATTSTTLDLANPEDKYALQMAALAKLAGVGKNAYQVAQDLAKDLSDDMLDGKFTPAIGAADQTVVSNSSTVTFTQNDIKATLEAKLVLAATAFGTTDTKNLVTNDPTVLGTITPNVVAIIAAPVGTDSTYLQKAKAMFAELRTTFRSLANNGKTGFLDSQATRSAADAQANVAPALDKVVSRLDGLGEAIRVFEGAPTRDGLIAGTELGGTAPVLYRETGTLQNLWAGTGSHRVCYTKNVNNDPTADQRVYCLLTAPENVTKTPNPYSFINGGQPYAGSFQFLKYTLTPTATAGSYTYSAGIFNGTVTLTSPTTANFGTPVAATIPGFAPALLPTGSGTIAKTGTTWALTGTFPPSSLKTAMDTVAVTATRTAPTASSYRYALTGSVVTASATSVSTAVTTITTGTTAVSPTAAYYAVLAASLGKSAADVAAAAIAADATSSANASAAATAAIAAMKVATITMDTGSYVDTDIPAANTDFKPMGLNLVGTVKTAATKLTGTFTADSFVNGAKTGDRAPTNLVFNGSISDTSATGIGEILTGKLVAGVTDYGLYDNSLPDSSTNYLHTTLTFTGTVQAPSRPLMKLVLSGTRTGVNANTLTLNYSYGTVSITGTGSNNGTTSTLTLSNQDGIQIAPGTGADVNKAVVTKDGALAKISGNTITYADNFSESLM